MAAQSFLALRPPMLPLAAKILSLVDLSVVSQKTLEFVLADQNDGSLIFNQFEKFVDNDQFWEIPDFDKQLEVFASLVTMREISAALDQLGSKLVVKNELVRVYRSLIVESDWMAKEMFDRPLGVYWSYDRTGVGAYDASPKKFEAPLEILLTADVDVSDIDWTETLALKAGSKYAHGEEFEIRLLPRASVTLQNIEWRKNDFEHWSAKQLPSEYPWTQANFVQKGLVLAAGDQVTPLLANAI
jgi:hypothetical protein